MDTMAISEFKATCLAVLEQVSKTGKPLLITRRGKPVAQISAPPASTGEKPRFGAMAGTIEFCGDVVSPLPPEDWGSMAAGGRPFPGDAE